MVGGNPNRPPTEVGSVIVNLPSMCCSHTTTLMGVLYANVDRKIPIFVMVAAIDHIMIVVPIEVCEPRIAACPISRLAIATPTLLNHPPMTTPTLMVTINMIVFAALVINMLTMHMMP